MTNSITAYDDNDAIDDANITAPGLRHAKPQSSHGYSQPDEEDLPEGA